MKKIAVLITCFNRKDKTIHCIQDVLNQKNVDDTQLDIFMVDGGSTDGTSDIVRNNFPNVHIQIVDGLYWAGGMRYAWKMAVDHDKYDFFWLVNDDTFLYEYCLEESLKADNYALTHFGKAGIYVGSMLDPITKQHSYGGTDKNGNSIIPDGIHYVECELGNANSMLVSSSVYDQQGGLSEIYTHGIADYDYTLQASRSGIPVLTIPVYVGACEDDHGKPWTSQSMPLKKRIDYLYSPKGLAYPEFIEFYKKYYPKKVFSIKCKLWIKTIFPFVWQWFKH